MSKTSSGKTTTAAAAAAAATAGTTTKGKTLYTASGKSKTVPHSMPTNTQTHTQIHTQTKAPSFRDISFESEIMKKIISYQNPTLTQDTSIVDLTYKCSDIFPDWITSNVEWKGVRRTCVGSVPDVLSRYLGFKVLLCIFFSTFYILERCVYVCVYVT
jgi:predicted phage gp36 major capsid-like protein